MGLSVYRRTVTALSGNVHVVRGENAYEGVLTACNRYLKHDRGLGATDFEHTGVTCARCVANSEYAASRGHWKD
jgi:hypothetical protein